MPAQAVLKDPQTAFMSVAIRGDDGDCSLGNVFILVEHEATGQKWRGLRYNLKTKSYTYAPLPAGRIRIRVVAPGYETTEKRVVLREGITQRVTVHLRPEEANAPLIIDVGPQLAEYDELAHTLDRRRDLRDLFAADPSDALGKHLARTKFSSAEKPVLSIQTEFLLALMCDVGVLNALTQPIYSLAPDLLSEWLESRILTAWKFEGPAAKDKLVRPLVERRVRLYALLKALVRNSVIGAHLHCSDENQLTIHLLRFLASLDAPKLDGVVPILVQLLDPELATIERLGRGLLQIFDARVPPGAASPRGADKMMGTSLEHQLFRTELASLSGLILEAERAKTASLVSNGEGDELREQIAALMFVLADIARSVAGAVCHSSLEITGLLSEEN